MKRAHATTGGRVTRRTYLYRRPKCKPLPIELQVLPKRLTPTPLHPGCTTTRRAAWLSALYGRLPKDVLLFGMEDHGFSFVYDDHKWAVVGEQGYTWFTEDWTKALGLTLAQRRKGNPVTLRRALSE